MQGQTNVTWKFLKVSHFPDYVLWIDGDEWKIHALLELKIMAYQSLYLSPIGWQNLLLFSEESQLN